MQRARRLADAFRAHGLPVVLVNVTGIPPGRTEQARFRGALPAGLAELVPELSPQPTDQVVSKQTAGAFTRTDLEASLRSRGVTQVIVAKVFPRLGETGTVAEILDLLKSRAA